MHNDLQERVKKSFREVGRMLSHPSWYRAGCRRQTKLISPLITRIQVLMEIGRLTASTARRIFTPSARLRLIGPSRWPHVLGKGFLARGASVVVVIRHNIHNPHRFPCPQRQAHRRHAMHHSAHWVHHCSWTTQGLRRPW